MSTSLRPLRPSRSSVEVIKTGVPAPIKRTNVSSACLSCRSRRRKCDGSRPCSHCARASEECIYQTDHRSKRYMQTVLAKSNEQSAEFNLLLKAIRRSSQLEGEEIVRALRSGDDVSTALKGLESNAKSPGDLDKEHGFLAKEAPPRSLSAATTVRSGESTLAPSILGLLQPFDQATSPPNAATGTVGLWTTVTNDTQIINHLLNLYFTYHHPICRVIPEPLIRADMTTGRTTYCSTLLVNSMLALACTLHGSQDEMKQGIEVWPSEEAFTNEAGRLLAEDPKPSLTAVAALTVLAMIENLHLRYQRAWRYSGRASRMALFLGLQKEVKNKGNSSIPDAESSMLAAVRQQLFWVCFQVDQMSSSNAGWQPQIAGADITVEFPRIGNPGDSESWPPTPALAPFLIPGDHTSCAFYLIELSKVVNALLIESKSLLLNQGRVDVRTWASRYHAWYESLPNSLAVAEKGPAHVIAMHMWYHSSIIRTSQPILAFGRGEYNMASVMCQQAAITIMDLLSCYRSLYGLTGMNALVVQAALDAYSVHLQAFPTTSNELLTVIETFQ
ncbi:fungal-specific transcription factor domain-containing protein [Exophiala viscosa]|uniref:Fungal-specific transcription factor domain-containing protein n=1 Tax=Exophiala viscosa TaxID=2486360 RepID=A0AAN6DSX6_9EURO|nr:fungal-specific transcription factor domain-containing protein [Exophiala viscosa]